MTQEANVPRSGSAGLADFQAGLVVTLVALPLCLGIALASGAPLHAGIIAGVIGGMVVGALSGSQVSVSGPAAGLTVVVLSGIGSLGDFHLFLCAVVLAGMMQMALGALRVGVLGHFFPSSVVQGLLAAIGVILLLKQIPHALGYDVDPEGDFSFLQMDGDNTFTAILHAAQNAVPGALLTAVVSFALLVLWEQPALKARRVLAFMPGPLVAVLAAVVLNSLVLPALAPSWVLTGEHLVTLPAGDAGAFLSALMHPDPVGFTHPEVWILAVTIAVVASLESLLALDAADRLDPQKRVAPPNRELLAQGAGNVLSGVVGGLPITSVVVRTTANISAGAQSKRATMIHGALLLLLVLFLPGLLNLIPLASLAAVLIVIALKLTPPSLYQGIIAKGPTQWAPFFATVLAILLTDLLVGVLVGLAVGIAGVIAGNFKRAFVVFQDGTNVIVRFAKDCSFFNRAALREALAKLPDGAFVIIDGTRASFIDQDIIETLEHFQANARARGITVEIKRSPTSNNPYFREALA